MGEIEEPSAVGYDAAGRSGGGYRELIAWQKAMTLVVEVYDATSDWPKHELYGLTSQVRRAAVSIPSNIAEGHGRSGSREFAHHASIAFGSLCELETQLLIGERLGYSDAAALASPTSTLNEVRRLLRGLLRSLDRRPVPS